MTEGKDLLAGFCMCDSEGEMYKILKVLTFGVDRTELICSTKYFVAHVYATLMVQTLVMSYLDYHKSVS